MIAIFGFWDLGFGFGDPVIKTHLQKLFQNHIYCLPISKQGTAAHLLFLHVSSGEARYYFFVHEGWSWDLASIPKSSYSCHGWKIVWKITSSLHWLQHICGLIWDAVFSLQPCHEWNYFSGLIQLFHHHLCSRFSITHPSSSTTTFSLLLELYLLKQLSSGCAYCRTQAHRLYIFL